MVQYCAERIPRLHTSCGEDGWQEVSMWLAQHYGIHCRRLIFTLSHKECWGHWQDWNNRGQLGVNKMKWVSL